MEFRKKFGIRPLDIVIFFLIATAGIFLSVRGARLKGSRIVVNAAGVKYEYSAELAGTYTVPGELGDTSFEIKDGRVRITDSPCPNKTCISQGWHNPLVCLPNKVMITVEGESSLKAGNRADGVRQGRGRSGQGGAGAAGQSRSEREVELDAVSE